ncbi:cell division protein FtsA [Chitinivibrio alkaliphilus]|uniref:Cell division protein FtsA n=1 Tax=Chitinivibrio alkaliphilus ACht1 TaxID=1313304 RepID=U7D3W1_9BACT|nr:cell division protein FtsA [Chitinivibrio alkaliphilus]ERP31194.1 cell division protein FtsA [Chitinivibrio alkaliphilus ACht1]
MAKHFAGLDIGTTKIACIIAEHDTDGGTKVIGRGVAPSHGLRKGVVVNIDKTVQGIRSAVREAEMIAGVDTSEVYVGIAGEHVQSFNKSGVVAVKSDGGEITEEDVRRAIDNASAVPNLKDRETISIVPQDYIVDDQIGIKDPIGMSGVRLETNVHIITCGTTSVQNICKSVEKAGFVVADVVLEPVASSKSVLEQDEREIGVALIDIGGGTTDIAIYLDDSLRDTRVIGLGGEYVTKDIAIGIRTPIDKAEEIKKKYGCADPRVVQTGEDFPVPGVGGREERQVSREILTSIIEPRVEEILNYAYREIQQSGYNDMLGAGIVLTGGGSLLEGIQSVAERVFEHPVKIGYPQNFTGLIDVAKSPIHATGIGLCMHGMEIENVPEKGRGGLEVDGIKDLWVKIKEVFQKYF